MMWVVYTVLYLAYLSLFLWAILRWKYFHQEGVNRAWLVLGFLLKVAGGVSLIGVYTYYYTDASKADIYRYFNDSLLISEVLWENPLAWCKIMTGIGMYEPTTFSFLQHTQYFSHPSHDLVTNNTFIIRIQVLLNYATVGNIYLNTLLMNFFSFMGLTALLKVLQLFRPPFAKAWLWPIFFIPSVVFWTSGPLKEQLLLGFIGFYLFVLSPATRVSTAYRYSLATLLLALVFAVKPPVGALLLICSVLLPVFRLYEIKQLLAMGFTIGLAAMAALAFGWSEKLCALLVDKRNEFIALAIGEHAGSLLHTQLLPLSCSSVWAIAPAACAQAVFGPYLWAAGPAFQLVFAIENIVMWGLLLYLMVRYARVPTNKNRSMMAAFCVVFAGANYLLIGLTVPLMGAIVHYRVTAIPFICLAVLLLTDTKQPTVKKKPR